MLPLEITARRWQRNLAWTTTEASLWMTKNLGISQLGGISLSKKQVLQVTEPTCAWGWDGIYPEGVIFLSPVSTPSYITKICSRSGFFHSILPPVPSLTPLPKCSIRIFHSIKQKGRLGNQTCSPVLYMSMQKSDPLHSVGSTPMLACTGLRPWLENPQVYSLFALRVNWRKTIMICWNLAGLICAWRPQACYSIQI